MVQSSQGVAVRHGRPAPAAGGMLARRQLGIGWLLEVVVYGVEEKSNAVRPGRACARARARVSTTPSLVLRLLSSSRCRFALRRGSSRCPRGLVGVTLNRFNLLYVLPSQRRQPSSRTARQARRCSARASSCPAVRQSKRRRGGAAATGRGSFSFRPREMTACVVTLFS